MKKSTTIAIDLAKNSFQICKLVRDQVASEKALTNQKLKSWLQKQPASHVVMEACGSAHHWGRFCQSLGHDVSIIAPKNVTPFRANQKTDKNDALAIAIAARQPNVHSVGVKTIDAQALQSIERVRQHLNDLMVATSNMVRGLILEFGIAIPKGVSAFNKTIPQILENGDSELPDILRPYLHHMYNLHQGLSEQKVQIEKELSYYINRHSECKKLLELEGIGPINALGLYLALGHTGRNFKNGREASACIGLTPKQYSTGGVTTMLGISKKVANKRLRANLIQGALSVVRLLQYREPKNGKETWLKALIVRAGLRRAAVALANKSIRTAWSMLKHGTQYSTSFKHAA